jgi:glycosyltransferase involved in cell wall biosynthesis
MAHKLSSAFIPNFVAKIRTENMKKNCRKLSRFIVLTNEEKNSWENNCNIEVIPNALSYFPDTVSTGEQKKVIAVGRLVYEKGFDLLIETWKSVYEKHPEWELHIWGEGNQKENLLQLITKNGLDSVIKIHPPEKDIYARFLKHSIFVFPSRYLEALPMVLIEAMSCGLPLVAFDAPCGPKDVIIDGKNGFLVETGNITELSEKINRLIESTELRKTMGEAARKMSLNYNEERIMKRWIKLFESLGDPSA